MWNDPRNLRDKYKGQDLSDIVKDRQDRTLPYSVALLNLTGDFNKSSAIRNANNFLAESVFIVGNKRWDRRGAVGSHNYMDVYYVPDLSVLKSVMPGYRFVAMENGVDAVPLNEYRWNFKTVMVFGEEQLGISQNDLALCDDVVSIPTMGTVRSLNVAVASGIAMYDYCYGMLSLV